jgi:hypothetical protein
MNDTSQMKAMMTEFAERTGLTSRTRPPRRYLWTDAFAVCNYLELFRRTGEEPFQQDAIRLVSQVHQILADIGRTIRAVAGSAAWTRKKGNSIRPWVA